MVATEAQGSNGDKGTAPDRRTDEQRCAPGAAPSLYYHTDHLDTTRKSTQKRPGRGASLCFPVFLNP